MNAVAEHPPPWPGDDGVARLRVPPHSIEAEQSVLGGLLLDNSAFSKVSDILSNTDFYRHAHRLTFDAIVELLGQSKGVDVITVFEQLDRLGKAEDCGGLVYLNALAQSVPSAANIRRYAEIVVERKTLRSLIALTDELATKAFRNDLAANILEEAQAEIGLLVEQRKVGIRRVPFLELGELREQSSAVSWLVKHVIPAESVGMLYGGSGTFKSFIALDAALHVAHGLPWLQKKTRQAPVLFVAAEGGAGLWRRIVAWHRARRIPWEGAPVYVVPVSLDLVQDAARVVDAANAANVRPAMVVVDTMSQTFSGEENSAAEVSNYLRQLGHWFRTKWGASVLVVHHSGHKETERARGSSAIRANVDFMFSVFRDEKEMLATLECVKQKDGELTDQASFQLDVVDLAKDEDGDPITSLVATQIGDKGQVLNVMAYEASRGRGGRNQLFLEIAQNGMEEKKVRQAFYDAVEGDAEAKRQAYFRCRKWAMTAGVIEIAEGFVLRNGA